ncbi:MAG: HD domain-containing protein [Elusimicrobiota bacterium]|jgi:poly(A) polymerase|nr:HD domain-containing protein [Elusimicrobiota bacterium]
MKKIFAAFSKGSFKKEPLKMLEVFRLAAQSNAKIPLQTLKQIKKDAKLISLIPPKTIKEEFTTILSCQKSAPIIELMDNAGLLARILPEIKIMKKADKRYYYHPKGLFQHSFESYEALEQILKNINKFFPKNAKDIKEHLADNSSLDISKEALMKLAILFHDNAKPETATKEDGKIRFIGHETRGARKIKGILKNLSMSKKDSDFIVKLVLRHMRPSTLTKNEIITKKAANRFFRDIDSLVIEQILISMADWHSYKRLKIHSPKELKKQQSAAAGLIEDYYIMKNQKPLIKIIDGHKIMKKYHLKPGPWIGDLLKMVVKKQYSGKIADEKAAFELISSKLTQIKKKYKIAP